MLARSSIVLVFRSTDCSGIHATFSDHDYIEEQERKLFSLSVRTMSLPLGRGMFTMSTLRPVATQPAFIPKLCLTGRAPPLNTNVEMSHIEVPPKMNYWPLFHNGVAAGLRVGGDGEPSTQQQQGLDSTWIALHKTKSNELSNEHAGFLMGLGLNGHLSTLATLNVHDYLCRGHEMTSIGLILGIASGK